MLSLFCTTTLQGEEKDSILIALGSFPLFLHRNIVPNTQLCVTYLQKTRILSKELCDKLPPGQFDQFVTGNDKPIIYMYVHYQQEACGKKDGIVHNLFQTIRFEKPFLSDKQILMPLTTRQLLGYGHSFLQEPEDREIQFKIKGERAILTLDVPLRTEHVRPHGRRLLEQERGTNLTKLLETEIPKYGLAFHSLIGGYEEYCQFTGGGDLYISSSSSTLAIHINDAEAEAEASLISAIEIKHVSGKQKEIDKQLRANLVAALTHHYCEQLLAQCNKPDYQPSLTKLIAYGVTFGTVSDVLVYKLVMNFETNTCCFFELFRRPYTHHFGSLFIDAALLLVIEKLGGTLAD